MAGILREFFALRKSTRPYVKKIVMELVIVLLGTAFAGIAIYFDATKNGFQLAMGGAVVFLQVATLTLCVTQQNPKIYKYVFLITMVYALTVIIISSAP